ncbi:MAG: esterase family protein [Cellulomonas sp.]|nr:esterase family protein [Cellulomonas sp.]
MFGPGTVAFEAAAISAAIISIPLALILWNRVRGNAFLRGLQRVLLMVLAQLLAIAAIFGVVNQVNQFYVTWSELVGSVEPGTPTIVPGTGSTSVATPEVDPATPDDPGAATTAPTAFTDDGSGLLTAQVTGTKSGVDGQIIVWTPPGYSATGDALPVLLTLDGFPGNPSDTFNGLQLVSTITSMISAGTMEPTIVVSATTNVNGDDWGCANAPTGGPQVATWLTQDVPDIVAASFNAKAPSTFRWQVMGLSAGAACSVRLTLTEPTIFSAAASLAGFNIPDSPILSGSDQETKDNDLRTLAAKGTSEPVALLLAASKQDGDSASDAEKLQAAVGPNVTADLEILKTGGHNWDTWLAMTPAALTWLAQHTEG